MIAPARSSRACSTAACTSAWCPRPARCRAWSTNRCTANARCYCAVGHPLFYADDQQIDDERLNSQDAIAPTFRLPADIQAHYQALHCTASASDREGMAFLILTGRYIGYLPDHYASFWVQQGRLRALKPAALL
jgi:DNA-binding transcriptional LysR family regulator